MFGDLSAIFSLNSLFELLMLVFLEIVLGVDNIVVIAITSNRLPPEKQHIGRRLGLAAAMCTRICLLFAIGALAQLTDPLVTLKIGSYEIVITVRSIIMLLGGGYLIYKGFDELRDMLRLEEERAEAGHPDHKPKKRLTIPRAVIIIALMDIVFSFDSVITAVGLVDYIVVAAAAIVIAIVIIIIFADPISNFINDHAEVRLLALFFIFVVGIMLFLEFFGIEINNWYIYFAMIFSLVVTLLQMRYKHNLDKMHEEIALHQEAVAAGDPEALAREAERLAAMAEAELQPGDQDSTEDTVVTAVTEESASVIVTEQAHEEKTE